MQGIRVSLSCSYKNGALTSRRRTMTIKQHLSWQKKTRLSKFSCYIRRGYNLHAVTTRRFSSIATVMKKRQSIWILIFSRCPPRILTLKLRYRELLMAFLLDLILIFCRYISAREAAGVRFQIQTKRNFQPQLTRGLKPNTKRAYRFSKRKSVLKVLQCTTCLGRVVLVKYISLRRKTRRSYLQ